MKHTKFISFLINLNVFEEEVTEVSDTDTTTVEQQNTGDDDQTKGVETEPDHDAQFEDMIKGDFKGAFDKRVHTIINKRFKDTKELETNFATLKATNDRLSEALMTRYNATSLDDAINKMEEESIENEAYERGVDVDEVKKDRENKKYVQNLETKNKELSTRFDAWQEQEKRRKMMIDWKQQEGELQQLYPEFDLASCASNQNFVNLLRAGVRVQQAYEIAFPEQFKARIEGAIVNDKKSGRMRENASETSKQQDFTLNKSVSKMSDDEILELVDRAKKGEVITLS